MAGKRKRTNWRPYIQERLQGHFRVGQALGNRAWEIWRGMGYVGLLVRHPTDDGRWAMTHNAVVDEDKWFTHTDVLKTVQDYHNTHP